MDDGDQSSFGLVSPGVILSSSNFDVLFQRNERKKGWHSFVSTEIGEYDQSSYGLLPPELIFGSPIFNVSLCTINTKRKLSSLEIILSQLGSPFAHVESIEDDVFVVDEPSLKKGNRPYIISGGGMFVRSSPILAKGKFSISDLSQVSFQEKILARSSVAEACSQPSSCSKGKQTSTLTANNGCSDFTKTLENPSQRVKDEKRAFEMHPNVKFDKEDFYDQKEIKRKTKILSCSEICQFLDEASMNASATALAEMLVAAMTERLENSVLCA